MSKYIIEIPDDTRRIWIDVFGEGYCYTQAEDVDDLEELNSDYINENFGELQDEAYKRGYEDGKWKAEDGCDGCKYYEDTSLTNPCSECSRGHVDRYEPLNDPDRIEVGDEVNWLGDCFIVTRIFQPRNMKEQCDGIDDDGCVYHDVLMDDLTKTGKHYDIQSILEAMRTHD